MRIAIAIGALAAPFVLAAGSAQAADTQLSCSGDAVVAPDQARSPVDVTLTVQGGLEAPGAVVYAWARPEPAVPMDLKSLSGDTLAFHGLAAQKDGGVLVADVQLNRATLALVLKVRRVGGAGEADVTLQTTCKRV